MSQTQLDKLKIMLDIKDDKQDASLQLLLDDVESDLLTWTNRTSLPTGLLATQRQLAVIRYNKQGIEGQISHSEGGISRSFEDLPKDTQQTIAQYRLLKVVKYATKKA